LRVFDVVNEALSASWASLSTRYLVASDDVVSVVVVVVGT
jgi:hypothetical protein